MHTINGRNVGDRERGDEVRKNRGIEDEDNVVKKRRRQITKWNLRVHAYKVSKL